LNQNPDAWRSVVDTDITGTLDLIQRVGRDMRENNEGKILVTGSIAASFRARIKPFTTRAKHFLTRSLLRCATN
jgi:uncharacterized protein